MFSVLSVPYQIYNVTPNYLFILKKLFVAPEESLASADCQLAGLSFESPFPFFFGSNTQPLVLLAFLGLQAPRYMCVLTLEILAD